MATNKVPFGLKIGDYVHYSAGMVWTYGKVVEIRNDGHYPKIYVPHFLHRYHNVVDDILNPIQFRTTEYFLLNPTRFYPAENIDPSLGFIEYTEDLSLFWKQKERKNIEKNICGFYVSFAYKIFERGSEQKVLVSHREYCKYEDQYHVYSGTYGQGYETEQKITSNVTNHVYDIVMGLYGGTPLEKLSLEIKNSIELG